MRKFSKILALLLAVSLVGGMFALTASATDETLVVSGTGAGGATPSMNRYYTFSGSDAAPTKTSTKYGNIFQPNGFYTYATNEIVTDASGNTYYKASGSGAPAANMYAFISGSPDLAGAKMTDYSSEAELVNNVVITEFDICAFDVDGDGYADWDGLRLLGGYVAYSANAAKADAKIAQPFSTLITDTTPGKWHHISLIATARPVSDDESYPGRVDVAVLVDGVHFGTYNFNSGYCATDTAGVEMVYYHIGAAKAASYMSGDWSIGLDNFVVNAYNKASYANADADTNTIAYLMSQGSYTAFSVIGVGDNAPLSSYSDSAYYTETYDPFDPNPAVATVDGVKYTSLDAALANLTDGKTL